MLQIDTVKSLMKDITLVWYGRYKFFYDSAYFVGKYFGKFYGLPAKSSLW